MAVTKEEFQRAKARSGQQQQAGIVTAASYDRKNGSIVINLNSGLTITFPPKVAEELHGASPEDLSEVNISPSGLGLHWPRIDADVYVPALLQGILGSEKWMASLLGSAGGKSRSAAKRKAAQKNGRKGGRPKSREAA